MRSSNQHQASVQLTSVSVNQARAAEVSRAEWSTLTCIMSHSSVHDIAVFMTTLTQGHSNCVFENIEGKPW